MPPVGKKPREAMTGLAGRGFERSQRSWRSSRSRHARKLRTEAGREHDHIILIPASAAAVGSIANDDRRASGQIHLLQLARNKKSDEAAIGRPERIERAVA